MATQIVFCMSAAFTQVLRCNNPLKRPSYWLKKRAYQYTNGTRMPILNIMDMIWIAPDGGPAAPYNLAVATNMIAASLDPVALDVWTTNHVLIPEAERLLGEEPLQDSNLGATFTTTPF